MQCPSIRRKHRRKPHVRGKQGMHFFKISKLHVTDASFRRQETQKAENGHALIGAHCFEIDFWAWHEARWVGLHVS